MNTLKQIYKENKAFLLPYLAFFLLALLFAIFQGREDSQIFVNKFNTPFLDEFFKYTTYLGTGYFLVIVIFIVAIFRGKEAGGLLFSAIVFTILVQALKFSIGGYRPSAYFELHSSYQLHFVQGVRLLKMHSFPSGHSATAFGIFFFLANLARRDWVKAVYLIIALLVAYSRVYLSQHFVIDVTAGSFIGVLSSYLGIWWYNATQKLDNPKV